MTRITDEEIEAWQETVNRGEDLGPDLLAEVRRLRRQEQAARAALFLALEEAGPLPPVRLRGDP